VIWALQEGMVSILISSVHHLKIRQSDDFSSTQRSFPYINGPLVMLFSRARLKLRGTQGCGMKHFRLMHNRISLFIGIYFYAEPLV
jgi:hypothetical protein